MKAAAIVAHGGGPTAVINASLAGVIASARRHPAIGALYGASQGLDGLVADRFFDLLAQPPDLVSQIADSSGSALGSSRRAMSNADFECAFDVMRRREVRYLFYTGGNGSMGTALEFDRFARAAGYELHVIGIPKTIDNDLAATDHAPGYASCARFFAHAVRDAGEDNRAVPTPVMVVEVLGRNCGWLVAATSLARHNPDDAPHLIYFPENALSADRLCADVERVYEQHRRCVVAVCEGQRDDAGGCYGADPGSMPGARAPLPANLGHTLARLIWTRTGLRARCERPGFVARSSSAFVSLIDRSEAFACGEFAVTAAIAGSSGQMVSIHRELGADYTAELALVPLADAAYRERLFPQEWMDLDHGKFREWALPIVGDVAPLPRLA